MSSQNYKRFLSHFQLFVKQIQKWNVFENIDFEHLIKLINSTGQVSNDPLLRLI